MKTDQYGQIIYSNDDLCNFVMQGQDITKFKNIIVDKRIPFKTIKRYRSIYGGDVIALGLKEGKAIGSILTKLEEYWEAHNYIFTRDELMKRMRIEVSEWKAREAGAVQ
jgi:hypothetical protein